MNGLIVGYRVAGVGTGILVDYHKNIQISFFFFHWFKNFQLKKTRGQSLFSPANAETRAALNVIIFRMSLKCGLLYCKMSKPQKLGENRACCEFEAKSAAVCRDLKRV